MFGVSFGSNGGVSVPPPDDYVAFYSLDTNSLDSSINGYDGTDVNGIIYNGTSAQYDGFRDYTLLDAGLSSTLYAGDIGVSLWFKMLDASTDNTFILGTEGGGVAPITVGIYYISAGVYQFKARGLVGGQLWWTSTADVSLNTNISVGSYYHLSVNFNRASRAWEVYIDSTYLGTDTYDAAAFSGLSPTREVIGVYSSNNGYEASAFYGLISNIRFYNKELSQTEITAIYNAERAEHQ